MVPSQQYQRNDLPDQHSPADPATGQTYKLIRWKTSCSSSGKDILL
jgi:hypothetical protein